jgi:hypothetical protein
MKYEVHSRFVVDCSADGLHRGVEPGVEPGTAVQLPDARELRRSLRATLHFKSYAAPYVLSFILVNYVICSTGERKRRPRGDRKSMEMSQHLKQTFEVGFQTNCDFLSCLRYQFSTILHVPS